MRIKYLFIICIIIFFTFSLPTHAQDLKGISVSPSIMHLDLAIESSEYEITYQNNTEFPITLVLSARDFSELENDYKINFLNEKESRNYKYSLSSWISFENRNIQLQPKEKKSVKIFIDKNRITKGGHYASILAEISQPENDKQVNIRAMISSLLFVRASTGKEIESGKINSLKAIRNGVEYPKKYNLRFENNGNVHVVPYGTIEVYDPIGNLTAKGIFNEESLDALPESIRTYTIVVKNFQKILLPGFYTTKANLEYGKDKLIIKSEIKFFSQGSFDFIKIGAGIILLAIIIAYKKRLKNSKSF